MFIVNWLKKIWLDFINIYDNSDFYGDSADGIFIRKNESFSEDFVRDAVMSGDAGKRKISVKKIFQRLLVLALVALFIFIFIRLGTQDSLWVQRR